MAKLIKGYYKDSVWHEYGGKLYDTIGYNTNGSMTQKAISDTLGGVLELISGYSMAIRVHGDASVTNLNPFYFVTDGESFTITITYNQPAIALNVTSIIMGETDITSTAYNDGVITIPHVTDNVAITVETASVTNTSMFTKRTTADGIELLNNKALLKGIMGNTFVWKQDAYFGGTITFNDNYGYENVSKGTGTAAANIYYDGHFPSGYRTTQMNLRNTLTVGHIYVLTVKLKFPNNTDLATTRFIIDEASSDGATTSSVQTYNLTNGEVTITRKITARYTRLALRFVYASTSPNNWIPAGQSGIDVQFRNLNAFDLTAMFGAGNEPTGADFLKMFPVGQYDRTTGTVINNAMASYVSKDGEDTTLQSLSLDVTELTGKLGGEGESVTIFPNGMKSSCNEAVNDTYDEIKMVDGVWKAIKRIGDTRGESNNEISGRIEYNILSTEQVYVLDDQTIPTELTVEDQGTEEILPTIGTTPTTAPAIMEIQYGAIPSRGLLGGGLTKGGGDDDEPTDDGKEIDYEEEPLDEPIDDEQKENEKNEPKEPIIEEREQLKK